MENVFEWAKSIEKGKRNKPNKQLSEQLFKFIHSTLISNEPSYNDCVNALMKFDKAVLPDFYRNYYPMFTAVQKAEWNKAVYAWAKDTKPTENVTIRFAIIIRIKLEYLTDLVEIENELRWLSVNSDKRSNKEYETLRDESKVDNLIKLLALDVSTWKSGKAQIEKMFSILFSESVHNETRRKYAEFRTRNGFSTESVLSTEKSEDSVHKEESSSEKKQTHGAAEQDQTSKTEPILKENAAAPKQSSKPNCASAQVSEKTVTTADPAQSAAPRNGIKLAQELLAWVQEQNEEILNCKTQNADKELKINRLMSEVNDSKAALEDMHRRFAETEDKLRETRSKLAEAEQRIALLDAKVKSDDDTIMQLQQMSENTAKQEMDGFKNRMAIELRKTAKDLAEDMSDWTDADKLDLYKALLDEMFDTLKHNGITVEVN